MSTDCLSHSTALHRPILPRPLAAAIDRFDALARRFQVWRAERAESRQDARIAHDLAKLSAHTLKDIGAPEHLINQRRWQEDHAAELRSLRQDLYG